MKSTAQRQFTISDVVQQLRSLGGRHDRFDLAHAMSKNVGDPMQAFTAIQEAVKARKVRSIKIGKGDSARFDVELVVSRATE